MNLENIVPTTPNPLSIPTASSKTTWGEKAEVQNIVVSSESSMELPIDTASDEHLAEVDAPEANIGLTKSSDVEPTLDTTPEPDSETDPEMLWIAVSRHLNNERLSKFRAGLILFKLQMAYGKAGHGTFVLHAKKFAADWGISVSTVYERIKFYKSIQKGRSELLLVCITAAQWAKWGDFDEADEFDRAAEEALSDAQVARMNALIAEAEEQVKTASENNDGKAPVKSLKLAGLSPEQRKSIQSLVSFVSDAKGGKDAFALWLFEILSREAELLQKSSTASVNSEVANA
jgi:hypothetical protein